LGRRRRKGGWLGGRLGLGGRDRLHFFRWGVSLASSLPLLTAATAAAAEPEDGTEAEKE
jgi:hypothetical protein